MADAPTPGTRFDPAAPFRWICGSLFGTIVFLAILQVICRSLGSPLTWTEELSRLLLIWMTFVAAGVVCYDGAHLRMDTIFVKLPAPIRRGVRAFNVTASLAFLAIVAVASLPILELSAFGRSGALDVPFAYFRAPAPVGAVLMFLFILLRRRALGRASRVGSEADPPRPTRDTI